MTDPVAVAYGTAAAAFVVGVGIVAALYASLGDSANRERLAALAIISGFAGISYVAMALGIGTVTVNGTEFVGFRYLDWVITTPLLIGFVGYVAGASRRTIAGVMIADALMIAFGAAGVVAGGTTKWVLFGVSSLFHLSLFGYLYRLNRASASGLDPEGEARRRIENPTVRVFDTVRNPQRQIKDLNPTLTETI